MPLQQSAYYRIESPAVLGQLLVPVLILDVHGSSLVGVRGSELSDDRARSRQLANADQYCMEIISPALKTPLSIR